METGMVDEPNGTIFIQPLAHGTQFAFALALRELATAVAATKPNEWLTERRNQVSKEISIIFPPNSAARAAADGVFDLVFGIGTKATPS
jgi:hypothetical protein